MSTTPEAVTRLYEQLKPPERVTLVLEALARGDKEEASRLGRTCPRKTYTANDDAFVERLAASFDLMAGACVDVGHGAGKLVILTILIESLDGLLTHHRINAAMAFFEGGRWAKGEPPGYGYTNPPADAKPLLIEEDVSGDGEDDGDGVEDEDDGDVEGTEEDGGSDGELSRRLDAVERQSDAAAERLAAMLKGMADAVAQPMVNTFAAFDRFARKQVGVGGMELMKAWGFPHADDLAATLVVFKHVKPQEDVVAEMVGELSDAWRTRLREDDGE